MRQRSEQRNFRLYSFNGRDRAWVNDGGAVADAGVKPWTVPIINAVLTTNVVTITTAVAHRLASSATVYINTTANDATYGGYYVVTVTSSTEFTYARTASNVATANVGGFVQLVPTIASTGTGNLTGTYRYFVAPIISGRRLSDGKEVTGNPSKISQELVLKGAQCAVSGIPSTHPDSAVTHWRLYRNQTGNYDSFVEDETQDFWRVADIAIGTTTFTDNVADKDLPPDPVRFRQNLPPAFAVGRVFGGRLFGTRFPPITTGTATVNTNTCLIDFASVTLPTGVLGCRFRKDGDTTDYEIVERVSSTQVALDRPFVGALSAATYSISRTGLFFSEYDDFDACGPWGESRRNRLPVGSPGSRDPETALELLGGYLYVFTAYNTYRVYGKGAAPGDPKMMPDPVLPGTGAVGPDAVWPEGGILYFLSLQGPMAYDGEKLTRIGEKLGTTWIDALNPDQLATACVGSNGRQVFFSVPEGSNTENTLTYVYDIATQTWWQRSYEHPLFYFRDVNSDGKDALFYAQGKRIFEMDVGANDGAPSGTVTGTITSTTTTSATDSTAAFYTTGSGLLEIYVHFFNPTTYALKGSRRITSNTATALTWSASGAGGGSLTLAAGDRYHVGPVYWYWKSKDYSVPAQMQRMGELSMRFNLQGESTTTGLHLTEYVNNVADGQARPIEVDRSHKTVTLNRRATEYAYKIEGRETNSDIAIRELTHVPLPPEPEK